MHAFFIRRPVFATVVALIITIAGSISITNLPVSWYPDLSLPQVRVQATYTGASSEVVENTVTTILETAINGAEGMRYMESQSSSSGRSQITVTFDRSRDLDIATVDVQNRVSGVLGRLPDTVRSTGVDVRKISQAIVLNFGFYAENDEYDRVFISNYVDRYVREPILRLGGLSEVRIYGERAYAMRVWVDPLRLAANNLTANDVVAALREQNLQVAAGQIGQPPAPDGVTFQLTVQANGRFDSVEQFENLVVRSNDQGGLIRLSDVGRAEIGAESYSNSLRFKGRDAVGLGIYQLPGANALDIEQAVLAKLEELSPKFPPGLKYEVAMNPTTIVSESIDEVVLTLFGTIAVVVVVIFLFLQSWRSTLIPSITIPVSLLGTFAFIYIFGFSINTLTLFGLVLATGLVVDDAIVVVENIERVTKDKGLDKISGAIAGTGEVFGAVVATSLVLIALFVPVSLFPGTTGVLYKQFALTIAFSIALSSLNALTLAPALSAILLTPAEEKHTGVFGLVNRVMSWGTARLEALLKWVLSRKGRVPTLGVFALLCLLTWGANVVLPSGFVPSEDQGYFITVVQAPPGTSLNELSRIVRKAEKVMLADEDLRATFAVLGFSFSGSAPNQALIFSALEGFEERPGSEHEAKTVVARLAAQLSRIPDATIIPFEPPAIRGLGQLGGFSVELQDTNSLGLDELQTAAREFIQAASSEPEVARALTTFNAGDPQLWVELDRERSRALGVGVDDAFNALGVLIGSTYVNDFTLADRPYRVFVQAEAEMRAEPSQIESIYVRSNDGRMVSLDTLTTSEMRASPLNIRHFNLFRTAQITGSPAANRSSGEAMAALERAASVLPVGFQLSWSGLSLEEREAGGATAILFLLGLLFVYLVLSAQYESFVLPAIILTSVPTAILGGLGFQYLRGLENDVFCQIGMLMLIGLAAKNAILIVEFAEQRREEGVTIVQAAIDACTVRLRPILMTSFAFILGVLPLVVANGASKYSRQSLGSVVFGGMLVSTIVNMVFIPLFYVLVAERLYRKKQSPDQGQLATH